MSPLPDPNESQSQGSGIPDDINQGRRTTRAQREQATQDTEPGIPDVIRGRTGVGRETARDAAQEPQSGQPPADPLPPDSTIVERAAGQTQTPGSPSESIEQQIEQEVSGQLQDQVLRNTPLIDESQFDITNIQQTDRGTFTGDVDLTGRGESAIQSARQQRTQTSLRRLGSTAPAILRDIAQTRQQRFERDVATNQFAQRRLVDQLVRGNDLEPGDIAITPTGSGISIDRTIGGRSRALLGAAQEQGFDPTDVNIVGTRNGLQAQLTDDAFLDRIAAENPGLDRGDIQAVDQQQIVPSDVGLFTRAGVGELDVSPGAETGETTRVAELTPQARAERRLERLREQFPNAQFEIVDGPDGQPTVQATERFDDDGRFLGIAGGESFLEDVEQPVGEFLGGAGEAVGIAAGLQTDLVLSGLGVTEPGEVTDVTGAAGARGAQVFNVPELAGMLDETGEVIGVGAAAGVDAVDVNANITDPIDVNTEPLTDFGGDVEAGARFLGGNIQQDFEQNPLEFTGGLAAGAIFSGGALALAGGARSATGAAARGLLQPGEELVAATTGVRVGGAARAAGSRAVRRLGDSEVNVVPRFGGRGMAGGGGTREITIGAEDVTATRGTEATTDIEAQVRQRLPDPSEFDTRAEFERELQAGIEQEIGGGTIEAQARQEMPPRSAFESEREFQSELEQRMRRIERQQMEQETETDTQTETETELGTQTTTAADVPGSGLEATTRAAFAGAAGDAELVAAETDAASEMDATEAVTVVGAETLAGFATTDTMLDEVTDTALDVGLETEIGTLTELATELETTTDVTTDLTTDLTTDITTDLTTEITTDITTELTPDDTDRRRRPELDLDFDSRLFDDPTGDGESFEQVFTTPVATVEDVLSGDLS